VTSNEKIKYKVLDPDEYYKFDIIKEFELKNMKL